MPPFITLPDLTNWPATQSLFTPPARLAVIGDPIAHSRSPQMHNPALAACDIPASYIRVQVPVGQVKHAFTLFQKADFLGVNITIPHKFEALDAVDHLDPAAQRLGAVNTLAIRDGKLHGYNTDGPGFLRSVQEAFNTTLSDLRILILGAGGGAGRAVAVQCALEGCQRLVLSNRTPEKASHLASELQSFAPQLPVSILPWDPSYLLAELPHIDLIVNATSLGMKAEDAPLIPPNVLTSQHLVLDMVYRANGTPTPLIADAQLAQAQTADGLTLLLHQGALSFEHWFNRPAPLEIMRQALLQSLKT